MNYFGEQFISKEAIQNLKNKYKNIICVEDITHDFLKRRKEQFQNDFTVCSIRKWFAIPDGGMVIGKRALRLLEVEQNSYFAELRTQAMKQKNVYLNSGIFTEKEEYRTTLAVSNNFIDTIDHIADIQRESMEILFHVDLEKIYELRRKNVKVLKEGIESITEIKSLIVNCENSTLYYPVCVNDKQGEIQRKMAEHSIYMPVIWPVPKEANGVCEVADCVEQSMLAIPCDHRYNVNDMKKIIEVLKECL
jgi:dTDP-4-amino-4,6-dideoxygalactose transaminase